ncbi:hypothetical protein FisN_1Hh572 [Fistulifera solaris]|jgi:hypothetical protein|uniref:RapZ C-terminal domain-containing protein n=1 Tax=Fistulifera solaris TaxID=1519565 RepID=A0A1Z5KR25_FISSO|nr:hypothetical protein FisN_1Hh572 [Fistulifera solaris]|eukprot:GAX28637.1 hypothetical protein FisN_1Hh572 [Fistulifera solaris]
MTAALVENDNDGFEVTSRKKVPRKNLCIGNLPTQIDEADYLLTRLKEFLREECSLKETDMTDVQIHSSARASYALLPCENHRMDKIIQTLHRKEFLGKKLVVQRERKKKAYDTGGNSNNKQKAFGSWSQSTVEHVGHVIKEEMDYADDPVNTAIAAAAAVGVMSSSNPLLSQPMDDLLADYGEQDLNWKQLNVPTSDALPEAAQQQSESQLTQLGKAPIHIQFYSFGYHHGAPNEVRNGWSHAQPLPVHDCRDLGTVPVHLMWQDGLSGVVKRELMWNTDIRNMANDLADRVADAVMDAINEGGHGYALPLKMQILVASELGKHRSVVFCELAATALRKRLRANENNQFREPCSVDTFHRDLPNRTAKTAPSKSNKKNIFED